MGARDRGRRGHRGCSRPARHRRRITEDLHRRATRRLCSDATRQTLTLTLGNQTRNQNLGSANYHRTAEASRSMSPGVVTGAGASADDHRQRARPVQHDWEHDSAPESRAADEREHGHDHGCRRRHLRWNVGHGLESNRTTSRNPGPGNLFTASGMPFTTSVSQCQQNYVFVQGPVDAERGSAQTVKVQVQVGGEPVSVSGPPDAVGSAAWGGVRKLQWTRPGLTRRDRHLGGQTVDV